MSKPTPQHGLIFQWLAREGGWLRILFGGLAALLTLVGMLLLFQVIYPTTRKHPLTVQRVLFMDPASPEARPILNMVNDQDFLLMRSSEASGKPPAGLNPVFAPSFQGFQLQPKDFLESRSASTSLQRLFRPDRPLLPPLAASTPPPKMTPAVPHQLQVAVVDGFEQRAITHPVVFKDESLSDTVGSTYRIAVAPDGHITLVMPLSDPAARVDAFHLLRTGLDDLRFQPRSTKNLEWGTIALQWLPKPP